MLTVFNNKTNFFLGGALLSKTEKDGVAPKTYRNHGFGLEAAKALLDYYAPFLSTNDYPVGEKQLHKVIATASPSNEASVKTIVRNRHRICQIRKKIWI